MISKGLLVTSQLNRTVLEYDGTTGAFVKVAASGGALGDPLGLVIGLDGNLLVSDGQANQVKRQARSSISLPTQAATFTSQSESPLVPITTSTSLLRTLPM